MNSSNPLVETIRAYLARTGDSERALSVRAGLNHKAVNQILNGETKTNRGSTLTALAEAMGVEVEMLLKRRSRPAEPMEGDAEDAPDQVAGRSVTVLEYDVRPQGGDGAADMPELGNDSTHPVIARWTIPSDYLSSHVADPSAVRIIRVAGDSMEPDYPAGERLAVDTSHRVPSPDGIYVLWDGFGLVVKRLAIIPASNPRMVRLSSINPAYDPYTVPLADIAINGRVIGRWQWR